MSRIPHELPDEFPAQARFIEQLNRTSREFAELAAGYDAVNRDIQIIESGDQPTSDEVLERLKKRRLVLKDEIAASLARFETRM